MKKRFIMHLLLALVVGLCAPTLFAQSHGFGERCSSGRGWQTHPCGNSRMAEHGDRAQVHSETQQEGRILLSRHLSRQVQSHPLRSRRQATLLHDGYPRWPGRTGPGRRPEERSGGCGAGSGTHSGTGQGSTGGPGESAKREHDRQDAERETPGGEDGQRCGGL